MQQEQQQQQQQSRDRSGGTDRADRRFYRKASWSGGHALLRRARDLDSVCIASLASRSFSMITFVFEGGQAGPDCGHLTASARPIRCHYRCSLSLEQIQASLGEATVLVAILVAKDLELRSRNPLLR